MRWAANSGRRRWLLRAARALALITLAWLAWYGYRAYVGEPSARLDEPWHRGHRIVDRNGQLLRELPSGLGQRGRPLLLDEVGDRLVIATLVSEDKRFHEHSGIDVAAVMRAFGQNARHVRVVSGASTITQQLVKLLDNGGKPPVDRGIGDKVREAARAQNIESSMSKRAILEAYLNRLSYGHNLVGPEAAAHGMFGVAARDLSWAQATLMAVLPRAPTYLDPYRHRERAVRRQRKLVEALYEQGWMNDADRARALSETIDLRELAHAFEAPHFVEAVRHGWLADESAAGAKPAADASAVTHTTIDLALQRDTEGLVLSHGARLATRRAAGAAVLVVDNDSGEVLAYVGSPDWRDDAATGKVDMVRARRQPGSALKPLLYAMAFESGVSPTDALADVPTQFDDGSGVYAPENFSGAFLGPVPAREALAGSLNLPAVRLAAELEPGALLGRLHALGFASLDRPASHYGLSLALGSGEVSMHELARAYVTLARGGDGIALRYVVVDPSSLGEAVAAGQRLISAEAAAAVSDSLSDANARLRGLGGRGPFDIGFPVAVKTGTSSGYRDTWAVGYTRERTVAVWVGNADGRATDELTGGSGAGPLFADVMRRAMQQVSTRRPLWDEGLLSQAAVCPLSGKPVGDACPHAVQRRLPATQLAASAGERCSLHRHAVQRASGWRCDAAGGDVVVALPDLYESWLAAQPPGAPGRDVFGKPWYPQSQLRGCSDDERSAALRIDDPPAGSVLLLSRGGAAASQRIELAASFVGGSDRKPAKVAFLLDGQLVATAAAPYRAHVPVNAGDHVLEVRPLDPGATMTLARSRFSVR